MFTLKFLGTADSAGIPVHNCECTVCKEYRLKGVKNLPTCAYIQDEDGVILLDAGIDDIAFVFDGIKIKAIFLTHFHADHALGLLRLRYSADMITCYHPEDKNGFADLFKHKKAIKYIQNKPFEAITVGRLKFVPIPLKHSKNTTGYVIYDSDMSIAYLSDCAGIDRKSINFLQKLHFNQCFIDATFAPHLNSGNHLDYEQASKILDSLNSQDSYFIHASHLTLAHIKDNNIITKYRYL